LSQSSLRNRQPFLPVDRGEVAEMMGSRFGIPPRAFEAVSFFRRGRNIWAFSLADIPDLDYEALGLRFISVRGRVPKPTTYALQLFGRFATKNAVHLSDGEARRFIAGERQQLSAPVEDGYVVVSYRGDVLGCGLYSRGDLISQLPKERRIEGKDMEGFSEVSEGCGR